MDESFATVTADDSLYIPTPEQVVSKKLLNSVCIPLKVCFMDLSQLDLFMKQLNQIRACTTPGCKGILVPERVRCAGLGGAVSIKYTCNGCVCKTAMFETSTRFELGRSCDISTAVQVAFIVAGCTHMTYYKVLNHALGIDAASWPTFQSTIEKMYPVVKMMVDQMCDEAKLEMKSMDQSELGSWSRAVTSADGTWMTRGYHSKNATFSIRNYYNGALLYRKHLCQKGRDGLIKEELYQGTSKGAEGYAARLTFKQAKEEGMNIAVQWQDADSSSANAVTDHFPNAEVMICAGHAARAHKKRLEKFAVKKSFSAKLKEVYRERFPLVDEVVCHCKRHRVGCGCLSKGFIERARNNLSLILSMSESAEEFADKVKALPRHARDEHTWDGGMCDFHSSHICSCGNCEDNEQLQCQGKDYHTRCPLSCPFHALAYEIECHDRALMSKKLIHPIFKKGHSNWLEASHTVFIRFRPKHINLERLHYVVSTELALLQSNMTYMYQRRGPQYHWVIELFRRMKLPVFDGVHQALENFNEVRKRMLEREKTEKFKTRRIQLKVARTKDAQCRKAWSNKHGHDTYGDDDSGDDQDDVELKPKTSRKKASSGGKCKACGSTTHLRSSHKECPFNKVSKSRTSHHSDDTVSANTNTVHTISDEDEVSSDDFILSSDSDYCFEDSIFTGDLCTCGAAGKAHKKDCPMSSRNRYGAGRVLFPSAGDPIPPPTDTTGESNATKSDPCTTVLGKRGKPKADQSPPAKKQRSSTSSYKVGGYVCLHTDRLDKQHVPCRVVLAVGKKYQLFCHVGILKGSYFSQELQTLDSDWSVSLEGWRVATKVSLNEVASDPTCLEKCECVRSEFTKSVTDLTQDDDSDTAAVGSKDWLCNPLYTLTSTNREEVLSPSGWLSDKVIEAAQLLILQQFPHISGLQNPILQQTHTFQVHRGEFVQIYIINVRNNHWCTISSIGCGEGEVKVYDSMYPSVSTGTLRLIASLIFSSASQLVVNMMDVGRQSNGSDCGVLAIAFAYDICSGSDPCKVKFNHKAIRLHLANCLEKCSLSRFPTIAERRSTGVRSTQTVDLHCSCRLPEERGDKMAECDICKTWYHQHCMDIPSDVFGYSEVPWKCKSCVGRD